MLIEMILRRDPEDNIIEEVTRQNCKETKEGRPAIWWAMASGYHKLVWKLAKLYDGPDAEVLDGVTLLGIAIRSNNLEMVKKLIEKGARRDKPSEKGFLPRVQAARLGLIDILKFLTRDGKELGGLVEVIDTYKYAVESKMYHIAIFYYMHSAALRDDDNELQKLFMAILEDSPEDMMNSLIDSIEAKPSMAICKAIKALILHGRRAQTNALLGKFEDLKVLDDACLGHGVNGVDIPYELCRALWIDVLAKFLNAGVDPTRKLQNGGTLLTSLLGAAVKARPHADLQPCKAFIRKLLQTQIDVESVDHSYEIQPLSLATILGDFEICSEIADKMKDFNHKDFEGWAAVHYACKHKRLKILKLLLQKGADVKLQAGKILPARYFENPSYFIRGAPQRTELLSPLVIFLKELHEDDSVGIIDLLLLAGGDVTTTYFRDQDIFYLCAQSRNRNAFRAIAPYLNQLTSLLSIYLAREDYHDDGVPIGPGIQLTRLKPEILVLLLEGLTKRALREESRSAKLNWLARYERWSGEAIWGICLKLRSAETVPMQVRQAAGKAYQALCHAGLQGFPSLRDLCLDVVRKENIDTSTTRLPPELVESINDAFTWTVDDYLSIKESAISGAYDPNLVYEIAREMREQEVEEEVVEKEEEETDEFEPVD